MFLFYLIEEQDFLLGNRAQPLGESLLEKGDVTVGEHTEGYTSTEGYYIQHTATCSLRATQLRVIYASCSDCDIQHFVALLLHTDGAIVGSAHIGPPAGECATLSTWTQCGRHVASISDEITEQETSADTLD